MCIHLYVHIVHLSMDVCLYVVIMFCRENAFNKFNPTSSDSQMIHIHHKYYYVANNLGYE